MHSLLTQFPSALLHSSTSCIFANTSSLQITLSHHIASVPSHSGRGPSPWPPSVLFLQFSPPFESPFFCGLLSFSVPVSLHFRPSGHFSILISLFLYLGSVSESLGAPSHSLPASPSPKSWWARKSRRRRVGISSSLKSVFFEGLFPIPPSGGEVSRLKGLNIWAGERSMPVGVGLSVPFPHCMSSMQMRCKAPHK